MGEEEERKRERTEAEASGNVYSRNGFCLSVAVLILAVGTLVVARPYIEALVTEASVSIDDAGDDDASSNKNRAAAIVHRQREMVHLSDVDKLLLKAQKEEDMDSDFITEFAPAAPPGYIKVDDYEDEEEWDDDDQEEERTYDESKVEKIANRGPGQGLAQPRNAPKGGATASMVAARRTRAVNNRPPELPVASRRPFPAAAPPATPRKETAGAAARPMAGKIQPSAAGTRHGSFTIRRRRHGGKPLVEKERQQQQPADKREHREGQVAPAVPTALNAKAPATAPVVIKASAEGIVNGSSGPHKLRDKAVPMPRKKLTKGFTVVPMEGNAYNLEFVEKHGKQTGYMSNKGPVKVWEHPDWPLRKNPKWQQPQHICPGAPKHRGLKDGEPKHKSSYVRRAALLMAEGLVQVNGTHIVENRCMFLDKDCADLALDYGGSSAMKMLKMKPEAYEQWRQNKLMDLKPRMLGSCALVANGDNLLRGNRGSDIDEHDTIFRHNTPIKGFEKAVGRRQSSVMWVKAKYLRKLKDTGNQAEFMYDLLLGVDKLPKSHDYRGKPLMIVNKNGGYNMMLRERIKWYEMAGAGAKNHPSGGFSRPLSLLASGLCTRVDIYGFSSRPSGKYFDKSFQVLQTHMMDFEHWVHRYLQKKGRLCVYGD